MERRGVRITGFVVTLLLLLTVSLQADPGFGGIVVAQDGSGDFETLTEAVDSLPMYCYERVVIFIKNGVYEEKILIAQDNITLLGESREGTIIEFSQARPAWIENEDTIGPAVINLTGDDIILDNLTIENTQKDKSIHAFAIYGKGTRTIIQNCNVWSEGGDTVSLWNYKEGMYYHANCDFRGAVDFVCPRGWCYIKDSSFYTVRDTAAIWHAGGYDEDQKFVLKNCKFDGAEEFELGRHHYEAQFFLIDCEFSDKVKDKPIYRVTYENVSRNRPFNWGERYYFSNATGEGIHDWMTDGGKVGEMTAKSTFAAKWDPESKLGPVLQEIITQGDKLLLVFDEKVTVDGDPVLKLPGGESLHYYHGGGSNELLFETSGSSHEDYGTIEEARLVNGRLIGTTASTTNRNAILKRR